MKRKDILCKSHCVLPVEAEASILCFLIAAIVIVPMILANAGAFALSNDFTAQEIPFGMLMNDALKSGSLWNWSIDIGSNYLECFAFYDIGSPFFWLSLLFPASIYPKLIGWIFLLKFAVAGATASLWLKRHLSCREAVLIGAILYTFSGFSCMNTVFYHFHDVIAFFPLMMTGLEMLVEEKKRGYFALSCAINVLCNPIFFYASAVFLILYFICSYLTPKQKAGLCFKRVVSCLFEGLTGSMMGAVVALPLLLNMLGNSRATEFLPFSDWFIMPFYSYLQRIEAFFLPAESMNDYTFNHISTWDSWGAYLPLFGMLFVLLYLSENRDRFSRIIVCCLIISVFPILNSVFIAFSADQYGRWLFMIDLILALVTAKVCEDLGTYRSKIQYYSFGIFVISALTGTLAGGSSATLGKYFLILTIGLGCTTLFFFYSYRNWTFSLRHLTIGVILAATVLFSISIGSYSFQKPDNTGIEFRNFPHGSMNSAVTYITEIPSQLPSNIGPYRYYFDEGISYTYYNQNMTNSLPSINSFISTCSNSITEFYTYLNLPRTTRTYEGSDGVKNLLAARYIVSLTPDPDLGESQILTNSNGQTMYLQENPDAIPVGGLVYTSYITESEFLSFDPDKAASIMHRYMVVKDNDTDTAANSMPHISPSEVMTDGPVLRTENINFQIGRNSFASEIYSDYGGYAFFSVPYDQYWHCSVNGNPVDILNINGLMAVPISDGNSQILFEYQYTPLHWALLCTAVGFLLCFGLLLTNKRRHFSKKQTA